MENELSNETMVATDATIVTINGKQNYIRNFSTKDTVVYHAMNSKSIDSLKELDFLKCYAGTLLHDHATALYHFGTDHAECNVYIIRYLRKNTEETGNLWSGEMIALLCEMNQKRKEFMEQESSALPDAIIKEYEKNYFSLLSKGRKQKNDS